MVILVIGSRASLEGSNWSIHLRPCALFTARKVMASVSSSRQVTCSTSCNTFHARLIRARPALRLQTRLNQNARRVLSGAGRPLVTCQHGGLSHSRRASVHNREAHVVAEVCSEEVLPKPVPAWQRVVTVLLKSTAVITLALALVSLGKETVSAEFGCDGGLTYICRPSVGSLRLKQLAAEVA